MRYLSLVISFCLLSSVLAAPIANERKRKVKQVVEKEFEVEKRARTSADEALCDTILGAITSFSSPKLADLIADSENVEMLENTILPALVDEKAAEMIHFMLVT